jgi:hypothetical protein
LNRSALQDMLSLGGLRWWQLPAAGDHAGGVGHDTACRASRMVDDTRARVRAPVTAVIGVLFPHDASGRRAIAIRHRWS